MVLGKMGLFSIGNGAEIRPPDKGRKSPAPLEKGTPSPRKLQVAVVFYLENMMFFLYFISFKLHHLT